MGGGGTEIGNECGCFIAHSRSREPTLRRFRSLTSRMRPGGRPGPRATARFYSCGAERALACRVHDGKSRARLVGAAHRAGARAWHREIVCHLHESARWTRLVEATSGKRAGA
jgi:hypothetical protein